MELRKADWLRIELCFNYMDVIDKKIDLCSDNPQTQRNMEFFYTMLFNIAFYEFALAYNEVQNESNEVLQSYLKKYFDKFKEKKDGGTFDGGFNF